MPLTNTAGFISFTTYRLLLKEITIKDAADLLLIRSNKEAMKYIDRPLATSIADAAALINTMAENFENGSGICWAICLKEDATLVGTIGFWNIDTEKLTAEFGYMLEPKLHNKGLMNEAFEPIIKYAFDNVKLKCLEALVVPKNIASINLLIKNSFEQEGKTDDGNFTFTKKTPLL